MNPRICELHRKKLLRFLLLKTAAVRGGIKPGELLRVRDCYKACNDEGFQFCLYRKDIFEILELDYIELRTEAESSLVLFYHKEMMKSALATPENLAILKRCGYTGNTFHEQLSCLKKHFESKAIPHEVGVFLGYPAKDVSGFLEKLPKTPVQKGDWQVFGDAGESLSRMSLYRWAQQTAQNIFDACEDLQSFFERISIEVTGTFQRHEGRCLSN